MRFGSFLELVEIRTKFASVIPFLLGSMYAVYHFNRFNAVNFIILFMSMFTFDLVTTALNNYFDFKRAKKKHGYNYETHNVIVKDNIRESTVVVTILSMLVFASLLGIVLFINTNIIVLLTGMLSFLIGICYSFGPVPISRTPFGELLSGFFMGFIILFLSIYIHIYDMNVISLMFAGFNISVNIQLLEIFYIVLLSVPTMLGIANIMLANNICDIEDDIENRRYTLPIYIGKKNALTLFKAMHYIVYADILLLCVLRLVPPASMLALVTLIPVRRNIKLFYSKQTKKDTFVVSVKNFVLICATLVLLFGVSIAAGMLFRWL